MSALSMYRGDTERFTGTVTISPNSASPRDITNDTLWFTVKEDIDDLDAAAVIQYEVDMPGVAGTEIFSTAPTTGVYYIEIAAADTTSIDLTAGPRTYQYDVQLVESTGRVHTIEVGTLTINPDITRSVA